MSWVMLPPRPLATVLVADIHRFQRKAGTWRIDPVKRKNHSHPRLEGRDETTRWYFGWLERRDGIGWGKHILPRVSQIAREFSRLEDGSMIAANNTLRRGPTIVIENPDAFVTELGFEALAAWLLDLAEREIESERDEANTCHAARREFFYARRKCVDRFRRIVEGGARCILTG
jgi:hypothetical protein